MGVILEETGKGDRWGDLRQGGSTYELVRDDNVFVCLWDASSSL